MPEKYALTKSALPLHDVFHFCSYFNQDVPLKVSSCDRVEVALLEVHLFCTIYKKLALKEKHSQST